MKTSIQLVITVCLLSPALSHAETKQTDNKIVIGSPERQNICGITALEKDLKTDMQKFKAVYNKYEEHGEPVAGPQKYCGVEYAYRALELGKQLFPEDSKNVANLAYNYAVSYTESYQFVEKSSITYAVERFEVAFEKDSAELLPVYKAACEAGIEDKQKPKDRYCTRAITLSKKLHGKDSLEYVDTVLSVSSTMLIDPSYYWEENKNLLLSTRNILINKGADKDLRIARINFSLGKLQASLNRHKVAVGYFEEALEILDKPQFISNNLTLTTHAFMVESLENLGMKEEATKHCLAISRVSPSVGSKDMEPLFRLTPEFPEDALKADAQGRVLIEFIVDESGMVVNPKVVTSTANYKILEDVSLATIKKYRYAPRIVSGKPVATEGVKQYFSFKIAQ